MWRCLPTVWEQDSSIFSSNIFNIFGIYDAVSVKYEKYGIFSDISFFKSFQNDLSANRN